MEKENYIMKMEKLYIKVIELMVIQKEKVILLCVDGTLYTRHFKIILEMENENYIIEMDI